MEEMCKIRFYIQLPPTDTIHKWTLAPEMCMFHNGAQTDVESEHWGGHQVSVMEPMCQIMFYNQLPTSDNIHKWPSSMCNPDTGADTKCPAMKPMCQIMLYNQLQTSDTIHTLTLAPEVGRFNIGVHTDVDPGHWNGHQVSGHETHGSKHVL